jgi:hypothetical protein
MNTQGGEGVPATPEAPPVSTPTESISPGTGSPGETTENGSEA